MENKKVLQYSNGYDDYQRFQFDRISPVVEVFHILPDGSEALNKVPKSKLKSLFKNLTKIASLPVNQRPSMSIGGNEYRFNRSTGLGTGINGNDYITIYLEDLEGKSFEYYWLPNLED